MKTYSTAYQAAKAYASKHDERDELEKNMLDYIDKLVLGKVLVTWPNDTHGSPDWIIKDGSNWYLFSEEGVAIKGPFERKKDAMRKVPEESAKRRETGVYYLPKSRGYVARKNAFKEWES